MCGFLAPQCLTTTIQPLHPPVHILSFAPVSSGDVYFQSTAEFVEVEPSLLYFGVCDPFPSWLLYYYQTTTPDGWAPKN